MSMLAVLIEQQDGDSFGISGREETPQERKRREGAGAESDEKAQERKRREGAGAESEVLQENQQPISTSSCGSFIVLWINLAMSQSLFIVTNTRLSAAAVRFIIENR